MKKDIEGNKMESPFYISSPLSGDTLTLEMERVRKYIINMERIEKLTLRIPEGKSIKSRLEENGEMTIWIE